MASGGPNSAAIYEEGLAAHRAGRLDEAARLYEELLADEPEHVQALQLLGAVWLQIGNPEQAAALISRAVALKPDFADAQANLAAALNSLGRFDEALAASDQAIALRADHSGAHGNRAQALRALGRTQEALRSYDQVIALNPSHAEAHCGRGIVLRLVGRSAEALASLDRAIALNPDAPEAHANRGNALVDLGRMEEAVASYDAAIALRPNDVEVAANKVIALRELRRPQAALAASEEAIAIGPDYADAHGNRGAALYDLRRLDEALESYDQAISLKPHDARARSNKGIVLLELRRLEEALAAFDEALAADPQYAEAHHNQAICRLALGDFKRGWAQYEWRWRTKLAASRRNRAAPLWLGEESLQGRTILLHAEQGLGDTLQFCRYAPIVAAMGATVFLEVQSGLERLLSRLAGVAQTATLGEASALHDFQTPLMSLPLALPAAGMGPQAAYLAADPVQAMKWSSRLGPGLRIGLCWAGAARADQLILNRVDQRRSLPLEAFEPLASVGGAAFYSLQKGAPAGQLGELNAKSWKGPQIVDLTAELADFDDTAALVANLDLVITCDTAVAHLAGGLGRPVWILNRFDACWRWLDARKESPWYPTARLFRQPTPGDWASVICDVEGELHRLVAKRS